VRDAKTHFHTIENRDTVGPKGKYFLRMGQGMVVPWWPFGGPMLFHLGYRRSNAPPPSMLFAIAQAVCWDQFETGTQSLRYGWSSYFYHKHT